MNFVKNLRIGVRIHGLVVLLLMLMLVAGASGLLALRQVTAHSTGFIQQDYAAADALGDLRESLIALRRHEKDVLINLGKADAVKKYGAEWDKTRAAIDATLARAASAK